MFILYLLLLAFAAAQETTIDPNDFTGTKPDMSYELEDLGDYSDGPLYPWLRYRMGPTLSRDHKIEDSASSFEDFSSKHERTSSDTDDFPEEDLDIVKDYDDNVLEEPTRRIFSTSPLELLGHFLSGKKKVINGINEGVLGGKAVLDGIHEITKGLGEFLSSV